MVVRALLAALAVLEISLLLKYGNGPFNIFLRFRVYSGQQAALDSKIYKFFALLVDCPFCSGVWLSAILALLVLFPSLVGDFLLLWLGIAGGQAFILYALRFDEKE